MWLKASCFVLKQNYIHRPLWKKKKKNSDVFLVDKSHSKIIRPVSEP